MLRTRERKTVDTVFGIDLPRAFYLGSAMPRVFACCHCGQKLRAPDRNEGRRYKCPSCGLAIEVPTELQSAEPELMAPRSRAYSEKQWTSGQAGAQLMQDSIVGTVFPYFRWSPTGDGRTSDEHEALGKLGLNGTSVFRCDDPLFAPWFEARRKGLRPCRCGATVMTTRQAAQCGAHEAQLWYATGNPPAKPEWAKAPPFDPWTDNNCELLGWGGRHSMWNDDDFRDHPGNPDRWLYEVEFENECEYVPADVPLLCQALDDPHKRLDAINALLRMGLDASDARPKLIALLGDGSLDNETQISISYALASISSSQRPVVSTDLTQLPVGALCQMLTCLKSKLDEPMRDIVCGAIVLLGNASVPRLCQLLTDRYAATRATAARALGSIGLDAGEAVSRLESLHCDRSKLVRQAAVEALRKIQTFS